MPRKFRCGRLILTKDGKIESVDLKSGGGSRLCDWDNKDMRFNEAHEQLLIKFCLNGCEYKTSFYDYQKKPLNVEEYETVKEYIDKYGLNPLSIVMYLCTHEVDHNDASYKMKEKNRVLTSSKSSTAEQKTSAPNEYDLNKKRDSIPEQAHQSSSSEYSFKKSIDELIKDVNDFINKNSYDKILNRIFENICTINGHVYLTIDQLNEQLQRSNKYIQTLNQEEIEKYINSLKHCCTIGRSTVALFEQSEEKYGDMPIFSTFTNSFGQLYQNLRKLKRQWSGHVDHNNNRSNTSSALSSISRPSVEPSSSQDHPKIVVEDSKEQLHISSTTSTQESPLSTFRELSTEEIKETKFLFRPVLNCFHNLLKRLSHKNLLEIRKQVFSSLVQIKHLRSNTNLFDKNSIFNAQQVISSLKDLFTKITNEQNHQLHSGSNQEFIRLCNNTLKSLNILSTSLDHYQAKIDKKDQRQDLYCVTSSRSLTDKRKAEDRPSSQYNKRKKNYYDHDKR